MFQWSLPPAHFFHRVLQQLSGSRCAASLALAVSPTAPHKPPQSAEGPSSGPGLESLFSFLSLISSVFVSGISTSGALGPGSTTTSTTPRVATSSTGRPTTTSASGRRNRSTSTPSPMADVPDEMTTHLPPAFSQLPPAGAESCDPTEARDIMWSRTRQGQVAKQPCPMGSIGESRREVSHRAISLCLWDMVNVQPGCPQTPVAQMLSSVERADASVRLRGAGEGWPAAAHGQSLHMLSTLGRTFGVPR